MRNDLHAVLLEHVDSLVPSDVTEAAWVMRPTFLPFRAGPFSASSTSRPTRTPPGVPVGGRALAAAPGRWAWLAGSLPVRALSPQAAVTSTAAKGQSERAASWPHQAGDDRVGHLAPHLRIVSFSGWGARGW